jgi:hypothetical protein
MQKKELRRVRVFPWQPQPTLVCATNRMSTALAFYPDCRARAYCARRAIALAQDAKREDLGLAAHPDSGE